MFIAFSTANMDFRGEFEAGRKLKISNIILNLSGDYIRPASTERFGEFHKRCISLDRILFHKKKKGNNS